MAMEEHQKKAFDFAADLTKQLITLSTGIIALTVTFSKDIMGGVDQENRYLLLLSWIFFVLSLFFGLLTLMALTGNLDPIPKREKQPNGTVTETKPSPNLTITSSNITGTTKLQVLTFFVAIILTCFYGYKASNNHDNKKNDHKKSYMIIRKSQLEGDKRICIDTLYVPYTQ
jgi:uncharacterized membrane protein (DUF485 family)